MDVKCFAIAELESARRRSLDLLAPLDETTLMGQHSRLMSPLVWDLAHVGNYEDLWLVRAAGRRGAVDPSMDEIYDAFRHGRADRPALPLLGPDAARQYIGTVRGRAFEVLDSIEFDPDVPLLADGFVVGLVVQHEHQHDETMLATLQLMAGQGYRPLGAPRPASRVGPISASASSEIRIPGGPFPMGTDDEAWAYDNERPAHAVDVAEFWIDTWPVINAQFQQFVDDGGYRQAGGWSPDGWAWLRSAAVEGPQFWHREGAGSWSRTRFGWVEDLPPDEPVQHISWYEADAFARWAGKRLPTEAEWEKAARWSPGGAGRSVAGRFPWGDATPVAGGARANVGGRYFRPAPVGSFPEGASPCGVQQMIGDVWEWTSSDFGGYPGFSSFPYPEYSEVFFGHRFKVLRGGSWATDSSAIRSTFRNWDYPMRRQIFAGVRCARDA